MPISGNSEELAGRAAARSDSITLASSFNSTGQKGTFCSTISCYTMSKFSLLDIILLEETGRDIKLEPFRYPAVGVTGRPGCLTRVPGEMQAGNVESWESYEPPNYVSHATI